MKKLFKTLLLAVLSFMMAAPASAEDIPTKIYAYGVCTSFSDSTVYITDIMEVDSAWVDRKTKFLYSRDSYSGQLREYFVQVEGVNNPTCVITFALDRKHIDKKYTKQRAKFAKEPGYLVKTVPAADFQFTAVAAADEYHPLTKAERKAEAKAEKERKKAERKAMKDKHPGGRPPMGAGAPPMGGGAPPMGGMGGM